MNFRSSAVFTLTESEFDSFAQSSPLPVLADFWAQWCSPCRFLAPVFEKYAREFAGKAVFVKINRDEAPALRARFEIKSIPRLILFQDCKPVALKVGFSPANYTEHHAGVKKMLGLSVIGRPNSREIQFRKLVAKALENYDKMVGQSRAAYNEKFIALALKAQADSKKNDDALAAGTVNADQHSAKAAEIKSEFETEMAGEVMNPLTAAYESVRAPAEILFKADILDATDLLFPLPLSADVASSENTASGGDFCAIGDPTCGG